MDADRKIIARMLRYRDAVMQFDARGFERVFSRNLADASGASSAQVRKDFSLLDIKGNRRGGYNVADLKDSMDRVLDLDRVKNSIVVGVGNIGRAILNYEYFAEHRIDMKAGFDINPERFRPDDFPPVMSIEMMVPFIREHAITLGIIAVPAIACQQVFELMRTAGVRGFLNFAPIWISDDTGCAIDNVNLVSAMEKLSYFASRSNCRDEQL